MFNILAHEFVFVSSVCPYCVKGTNRQKNMPQTMRWVLQFTSCILGEAQLCTLNCHKKCVFTGDM